MQSVKSQTLYKQHNKLLYTSPHFVAPWAVVHGATSVFDMLQSESKVHITDMDMNIYQIGLTDLRAYLL